MVTRAAALASRVPLTGAGSSLVGAGPALDDAPGCGPGIGPGGAGSFRTINGFGWPESERLGHRGVCQAVDVVADGAFEQTCFPAKPVPTFRPAGIAKSGCGQVDLEMPASTGITP